MRGAPPMTMLEKLLLPEIRELIQEKELETLHEVLNRWLPADIADLFADLADSDGIVAFQSLDPPLARPDLRVSRLVGPGGADPRPSRRVAAVHPQRASLPTTGPRS